MLNLGTGWQIITSTLSFSNATTVDLALQGYFQINSGTPGAELWVGFSLDGLPSQRTSVTTIPAVLYDGVNIVDHLFQVGPGSHTLTLWAHTSSGTAALQWRQIEFVGFPAGTAAYDAISSTTKVVSAGTTEAQPTALESVCGKWTKLLEFTVPSTAGNFDWLLDGYVQFLGSHTGSNWGQLAFEVVSPNEQNPPPAVDMGVISFKVPNSPTGLWNFGDALLWGTGIPPAGSTVRLWTREVLCAGGAPGNFSVGKRYMSVKLVSFGNGCYYR